jgi:hypothetical protein
MILLEFENIFVITLKRVLATGSTLQNRIF